MSERDDAIEQRFHFVEKKCEDLRPGNAYILCNRETGHPGPHELMPFGVQWTRP